jgi:hypothetical protein
MEQLVISFGLGIALSFGVVLLAMILRAAIMTSRSRPQSTVIDPARLAEEPPSYEHLDLAHAVRGYDAPELWRDDTTARQQRPHQ